LKNKFQDLLMLIMSICVLICAITVFLNGCAVEQPIEQTEQPEPEALVIETLPEATSGVLTILDGNGGVYFQYEGEIDIINNGKNGQPIEIMIDLPDTGCSCFDEEGRLKE